MRTEVGEQTARASAEAAAQAAANQEILRAVQAQAGMHTLIEQLSTKVDDLQHRLAEKAIAAEPIDSALREEYVERAAITSRPLLTEAQVRRIIDRMLAGAGWAVQDRAATNVHAGCRGCRDITRCPTGREQRGPPSVRSGKCIGRFGGCEVCI